MLFYIFIPFWVWLDILTKKISEIYLNRELKIIWDFFTLKLSYNKWIAFSMPIEWLVLKIITILLIILFYYIYLKEYKSYKSKLADIGFSMIIWWAIGNAIQRLLYSNVTDFIKLKYFAIFNFADIFISVWMALIIFFHLFKYDRKLSGWSNN